MAFTCGAQLLLSWNGLMLCARIAHPHLCCVWLPPAVQPFGHGSPGKGGEITINATQADGRFENKEYYTHTDQSRAFQQAGLRPPGRGCCCCCGFLARPVFNPAAAAAAAGRHCTLRGAVMPSHSLLICCPAGVG